MSYSEKPPTFWEWFPAFLLIIGLGTIAIAVMAVLLLGIAFVIHHLQWVP